MYRLLESLHVSGHEACSGIAQVLQVHTAAGVCEQIMQFSNAEGYSLTVCFSLLFVTGRRRAQPQQTSRFEMFPPPFAAFSSRP
jgi:hypothetical protein